MTKVEISLELANKIRREFICLHNEDGTPFYYEISEQLAHAICDAELKASREKTLDELAKQEKEK